ncbi:MAG: UDP-2,4-diacetamido-2,4,6-trideoxy-beta-L-altropyranose hydrolase [Methylococcales symbiont of Iophon sp. n. MRB-2018]|nr:MAG: UDP-2,4-diacetamido-2,4,6-trideoxy-beta-L-altropyranose hydrolase [Methylococcales symbiont of Iophon sp. n. MRB-2018]KAF3980526.1 MAG: UDP-2,4-diacetamido-2,4,6-trideoxy-beta-L-altropyranose hydrolase [Methylococcales symbiont of Iophon sp. n. MRB-2018]
MNILFRVDSSSTIGLGHLMRCLVLAGQYKTDNIIFAAQDLGGNVNQKIIATGYQLNTLASNKADELITIIKNLSIDMVVFDHYQIDYKFEKNIKDKTAVKILSFDDVYDRHYCDILLNHNIYAKKEQYKNLVPDFCEIRCGAKYTLIRDEFRKIQPKNRQINKINPSVFVAMGGSDTANISLKVLKVLIKFSQITVNLATTNANPNINTLLDFAKQHKKINIHINHSSIAELMDNSDFAVITPSVTSQEIIYLNLPFIAIKTADNQLYLHQYLQEKSYHSLGVFNENKLISAIEKIL